jgi:hypothetical protein
MALKNVGSSDKVYANVAIISPKDMTAANTVSLNNFFKSNGATRCQDFSTVLPAIDFRCLAISTDQHDILKHKRMILGPNTSTEGGNSRTFNFYVPMKRQIRYDATGNTPAGKEAFLVYWFDQEHAAGGSPQVAGIIESQISITRYWKEPCC